MPWHLLLILFVPLAIFAGTYAVKPVVLGRSIRTVLLLCVTAFCAYGFLASFELPGDVFWKAMYSAVGVAALAGAAFPWIFRPAAKQLA